MKKAPQGHSLHSAFTMIELIFVIVVLGILSAVALPKFTGTKDMADVSKGRADVAAIRSSILTERQSQLIKGEYSYIPKLCAATTTEILFVDDGATPKRTLLTYGIVRGSASGQWTQNGSCTSFKFKSGTTDVIFTYDNTAGTFSCLRDNTTYGDICKKLVD